VVQAFARIHDPGGDAHEVFFGVKFTTGSFGPGKPMKAFAAGAEGVVHVVLGVAETTT
jgi:extradiol dioxygenase